MHARKAAASSLVSAFGCSLRVRLVLGGVERGDAFGRVEGELKIALRPPHDVPEDVQPAVRRGR
jgi:hypothetical protein